MSTNIDLIDPLEFVGPDARVLLDTSVFMDETRRGALPELIKRCAEAIRQNKDYRIVVPTDVVAELTRQSRKTDPDRKEAIERAGKALEFIEDTEAHGLLRTDIGHEKDHYADSVFDAIFKRYANKYDMCLLINDITPLVSVRLVAQSSRKRLIAGALRSDGLVEVESNQSLYERAVRKLARKEAEGDIREVETLRPLLADFRGQFDLKMPTRANAQRATRTPAPRASPIEPFDGDAQLRPPDEALAVEAVPETGDEIWHQSPSGSGSLVLGPVLGEGAEGTAYEVDGGRVVKIFNRQHISQHRRAKVSLLTSRSIEWEGICVPLAVVSNAAGEFVGYMMTRARGSEFRVIMNPRRFLKTFPDWTKADLVDVCISFLEKIAYLHSLHVIVGDINPKNVIVDENKNVWVIDADSWQLEGYPCPVGTPMFTPASAQGKPYSEFLRTMEDELFAVATMLFMVLITGQFPYARAGTDGDISRLITDGNFAFQFGERSNRDQPEGNWKYMWSHLPRDLKEMFWHTFHREGDRYGCPPSADEWLRAFRQYRTWLKSDKNFDPMSNDVYPFRFKAFRPDTPIHDCPQCQRKHALVGEWNEAAQNHTLADMCFDCRQQNRPKCLDCGTPKSTGALRDGRCRECNRKRNFAACGRCGKETPVRQLVEGRCIRCQLGTCKTCSKSVLKSDLSYGRCAACEKHGKSLDPYRRCIDCHEPFIEFDHVAWFEGKGLDVAKSHTAIRKQCSRPSSTPSPAPRTTARTAPRTAPRTTPRTAPRTTPRTPPAAPQPRTGFFERLMKWFTN